MKSVRIRSYSGPHFPVFRPNAGKCGPEKLRIRTLFTQCKVNGLSRNKNGSDNHFCEMMKNEFSRSLSGVVFRQMTENLCLKYHINKVNKRKRKATVRREQLSSTSDSIS